jgi:glutamine amidotransferase
MLVVLEKGPGLDPAQKARLYESLVKAARRDPHSVRLFGEGEESHGDGWGFLSVRIGGRGVEGYTVHRSVSPVYEEGVPASLRHAGSPWIGVVHARAASTRMPVNVFSVHPVEAQSPEGYKLFLAHNGAMDRDALARAVGASDAERRLYNDTHFLARLLAVRHQGLASGEALEEASAYTRTAMNIAAFLLSPSDQVMVVGSYYKAYGRPEHVRGYYRMYMGVYGGTVIYASSTIVDYYDPFPGAVEWVEVPNGAFDVYRVSGGDILYEGRVTVGGGD